VLVLAGLGGGDALAHKVSVFAVAEGEFITGECYFSGGGRPKDCVVEFFDSVGRKLGQTRTDAEGRFSFRPNVRTDHLIVLDTGDGHRTEFTISAAELPAALSAPPTAARSGPPDDLDKRIARAVAKELRPLREQLSRAERRIRLRDILGGIGYIFGLAGVAAYFNRRRKRNT